MAEQSTTIDVSVDSLRRWSEHLFDHLEEQSSDGVVRLPWDHYWAVTGESALFDPYTDPQRADLSLGQLSWDIESLEAMVTGQAPTIGGGLVWLAAVIAAAGYQSRG